jgi:hypothetical protein
MKSWFTISVLALMLTMRTVAAAQESHINVSYEKSTDTTSVSSDLLYVIDMPTQFMQIQFTGRYPNQGKPKELPYAISVEFHSFGTKSFYNKDDAHHLRVKAGDEILDVGLLNYARFEESSKDQNYPDRPAFKLRGALPSTALVASTAKIPGLTLELMSRAISLRDLATMARANEVLMKIGDTVFQLKPTHVNTLREFVAALSPSNIDPALVKTIAPLPIPKDIPSDANNSSLDETFKWLRAYIEREGTTNDVVVPKQLQIMNLSSCRISYRKVPVIRNASENLVYAIMEYQMNLADLNPEAVTVADYADHSSVFIQTHDAEPKIKIIKRANTIQGTPGRTLDETLGALTSINLKNHEAASHFRVAFAHAINLCHAQR